MKKIGIYVDNNKLEALRKSFDEAGYNGWNIKPFTLSVSFMTIEVPESDYKKACADIREMCTKVKLNFSE